MISRWFFISSCTTVLAASLCAQEITLDQIVQKNLEALGGAEAIKNVSTLSLDGKMVVSGGQVEAPMSVRIKRPGMVRTEMSLQGNQIITAWDGSSGWMINPMQGSSEPKQLDESMVKSVQQNADIETSIGALASFQAAGQELELQGKSEVEGVTAYKIKVARKSGDAQTYFIDANTWLPVKVVVKSNQMGRDMEIESFPGNYKKVSGVLIAFSQDQRVAGRSMMQLLIEKIEINQPIDDAVFKMPPPAPKAAEEKK